MNEKNCSSCKPTQTASLKAEHGSTPYEMVDVFVTDGLLNLRFRISVPLDYKRPEGRSISVVANVTQKYQKSIHGSNVADWMKLVVFPKDLKVIAYCQGGPGFPCAVPLSNSSITGFLIEKGYQIVYYDQRGTGLSHPIEADGLLELVSGLTDESVKLKALLDYMQCFRVDSIVEDMEVIRRTLLGQDTKWSLLGQSYGGFCCFTYLSMYQLSLEVVLVTGGIPPIGQPVDRVYEQTYKRTTERNVHYYRKYPQDVQRVKQITKYLSENRVILPNGGTLSVERFQQLGIRFGATGGTDAIHQIVVSFSEALQSSNKPTYAVLNDIQNASSFDTNIIYALFQEAIYCDGPGIASNWSADRMRYAAGNENYVANTASESQEKPVYFTGEMVYRLMFDDYVELSKDKDLADALHKYDSWSRLYSTDNLQKITWDTVPVVAACYYYDQYVDFELGMETKKKCMADDNLRQYISSDHFHNGLRANTSKVLGTLFKLLEAEVD